MKTLKLIALLFVAAAACFVFGGCSHLDSLYDREIVEVPGGVVTNFVFRTNIVVIEAAQTNAVGDIVPATVAQIVQPEIVLQYLPPTYVTNLVPRAVIENGIKVTGAVPVPWAGTAAMGLGWLYSAYASIRNKKVAAALAQSVQVGREFLQSTPEGQALDAKFKEKLKRHQQFVGAAEQVRKLLDVYVPNHTTQKG